jgi:hypothetical protein
MGADYAFYCDVYKGTEADEASFPALCARAGDVVGALTRWVDISGYPERIQTLYNKAVCAQVDYFAVNGLDAVAGGNDRGFTVGKVSISGRSDTTSRGAMSGNLSPMVMLYLEQTGLMAPQVETAADMPFVGWL